MKSSKQTLELPISVMESWGSEFRLPRGENPQSADHYGIMRSNMKSGEELKEKGLQIKSIKYIFPNRLEKLKKISNSSVNDQKETVLYTAYRCAVGKTLQSKLAICMKILRNTCAS